MTLRVELTELGSECHHQPKEDPVDIAVRNEGSIVLLCPKNEDANDWLTEHLDPEVMTFAGAFCIEPRYLVDIVEGAIADGYKVGCTS